MAMDEGRYQANGTLHVHSYMRGGNVRAVTFVPDQYVEQNGSKFVVFLPLTAVSNRADQGGSRFARSALVVNGRNAELLVKSPNKLEALIVQAAVERIKVTALVSPSLTRRLTLEGVIIPAIPTRSTAE